MKTKLICVSVGFILGITVLAGLHFIKTVQPHNAHYHANFAVYINGQRYDFSQSKYMEEVAGCNVSKDVQPKQRAHMHNNVGDLVHVHDQGVTWGHFFTNIGWNVGKDYLVPDSGDILKTEGDLKLTYFLNDAIVTNVSNVLIKSEDVLLINFSSESDDVVRARFTDINRTAHEANSAHDPATCGSAVDNSILSRIKKSLAM
jgi:hypothetical protein